MSKKTKLAERDRVAMGSFFSYIGTLDEKSAILALSAYADTYLELLLFEYLGRSRVASDLIEGFNAPLGTFSSRIKLAYALKLIPATFYADLNTLREIRNAYAHDWEGFSIESPSMSAKIAGLKSCPKLRHLIEGQKQFFFQAMQVMCIGLSQITWQIEDKKWPPNAETLKVFAFNFKEWEEALRIPLLTTLTG